MIIDYSKLRPVTARQLVAAVQPDGFTFGRQRGSQRRYGHVDGRCVTLTFHHVSDTFPLFALQSIIERQACWNE